MRIIHVVYSGAKCRAMCSAVSEQIRTLRAEFDFSADWNAYPERTAVFVSGARKVLVPLDENNACEVPASVSEAGSLQVGAFAVAKNSDGEIMRYPGEYARVWLAQGVSPDGSEEPGEEEASAYEKMLTEMREATEEAKDAAEDANINAENASAAGMRADSAADAAEKAARRANDAAERAESVQPGGGITEETDPTVPAWAKKEKPPTYTAEDVGLENVKNERQYSAENPPPYPVTSVNGKTGDVKLGASDVGALPADTKIPASTSDITNNSGFITRLVDDLENYYSKNETYTRQEIRGLISAIPKFSISVVSALPTEDISTTTVYLLKAGNQSGDLYTEYIYTGGAWEILGSQRVDLTGYATEAWVNAKLTDYLTEETLTGAIIAAALGYTPADAAKVQPEGDYALRSEIPSVPVQSVNGEIGAVKLTASDVGATTQDYVDGKIADLKAQGVQQTPLFAESLDWLNANGDKSKMYVLPDGFIYAYMYSEAIAPTYKNLSETVHENYRMGSGGALSALTGAVTTDFIPVRKGQLVRFKGFNPLVMPESKYPYVCFYTAASESATVKTGSVWGRLDWLSAAGELPQVNGVYSYTAFASGSGQGSVAITQHTAADSITHIRLCGSIIDGETVVVTVDEEITEGTAGGYSWKNTGHAFVPADYEDVINKKANKDEIPTKLPNPGTLTINGVKYDGSENVNIEPQSGGNILYGKKWVACGDSFTYGGYNASDGFDESEYIYQDGRFAGKNIVYPYIIGLRNNMNVVNLATGGQTMAVTSANNSFMTRYENIDADADYITIMLGINDKLQGVPVGALDSVDQATFCGAFNVAMEHILENHPCAHIGIMVSNGTNAELMQATRDIAERWGVPYLDYGSPQVPLMNRYTGRNVCAKAQEIRERNFCIISDGITPTNAHPNTKAHEFESAFIEAWLRTL